MTRLRVLAVAGLFVAMVAHEAPAQLVRGGVRGGVVGGLVGGSSGAKTGAKVGAAVGATKSITGRATQQSVNAEAQARTQYQSSAQYQDAQHSDFNQSPPQVIVSASDPGATVETKKEVVIKKDGKPVLGITYPADWRKREGTHSVSAVSSDGTAWSAFGTLDKAKNKDEGMEKVKEELAKYLEDMQYDEPTETEKGALIVTGTGKAKKAGIDVVFAAGVFPASEERLAGAAFVVDSNIEDHYKETVRMICQTIRVEKDFARE